MLIVTDLSKLKDYGFLNVYEEWKDKGVRLGEETKSIYYKDLISCKNGDCSLLVNNQKNATDNEIKLVCDFEFSDFLGKIDDFVGFSSLDVLYDLIKDGVVIKKEC